MTEKLTEESLKIIKDVVGEDKLSITVSYVGVTAPTYTVNSIFLWTGGTDQSVIRVALKPDSGMRIVDVKDRLRHDLPDRLIPWMKDQLVKNFNYTPASAAARASQMSFSFEPADVVNQVMAFGSPTPVEVVVSGPDLAVNQEYAEASKAKCGKFPPCGTCNSAR